MNILHLSSENSWRGGEQQIAYLIEESIKHGIKCIVGCKKDSAFEKWCIEKQIPFYPLGFKNQFDVVTSLKIKSICEKEKIDFVHMHSSHSHAVGVWASVLGNKTPNILSRRVDFPIKNNPISRFKYNHPSILKTICVSDAIKTIMQKDVKHPEKCITIHSGIDLSRFENYEHNNLLKEEFNLDPKTIVVGNISAIAPHKDYPTFIKTAKKILETNDNFHFFIIGDGPSRSEIETEINRLKLNHKITLTGFRTDIPKLINALDIFLITSETEGLGTTILDAAANKIPVVATRGGGIPEFIEHNKTGLLSNIYDSDSLAENVLNLSENEGLQQSLTENAHNKLIEQFTKERTAQQTFKIYEQINNGNSVKNP